MDFDTNEIGNNSDLTAHFHRMKSLSVKAGGKTYSGDAVLEYNDEGHVTIVFATPKKKRSARDD